MKKKILAVILTLAMIMTMFSGCGSKDSTYFKELKEACKITTGTETVVVDGTYKGDVAEAPELIKDKDGNIAFSLKMEATAESDTKSGVKISVKLGQEEEYSELTTFALDNKKFYITVDPIIALVKKIDPDTATQLEAGLAQMGISGAVSLDLEQLLKAVGEEYPEVSDDMKKSVYDLINNFADAMEKNFKDLEGRDGDDYTLKLNGDNAEKAVNGAVDFLKNDAKGLLESAKTLISDVYGEDGEMVKTALESYDELIDELPDAAKEVEDNKDDAVKAIKDNNLEMISKIQVSGKEGSREAKLTFESGNIKIEDSELQISVNCDFKEGKAEVKDLIPENASDITTMLVTMLNQMSNLGADTSDLGGTDDGLTIE
ncbi:MAG: hypothetical protein ACLRZ9_01625 [Eubacterium sp.]